MARSRLSLTRIINTILKIQPLYNNADVTQLRKFYDTVEQHCRGLQALGVDSSSYGTILVNILLQRLPENIKLIISRKMGESSGDSEWKIEELLDILKTEVEAREKCSVLNGKTQDSKRGNNYKSQPATAAALFTANRNRVPNCTFCKGVHASAECHVVTSIKERKNCLLKQGRCFLCMRKAGHLARDCDSSIKCFRCRGHRHVALCERSRNFYTDSKKQLQSSEPVKEAFENKDVQEKDGHSQTTFCGVNTGSEKQNTRVLLKTAYVKATNPEDASQNMKLRVILDSGSQRTYITKRAREILNLNTVDKEKVIIKTFGQDQDEISICDLVNVQLKSLQNSYCLEVNALEVPMICSPLLQGETIRWAKSNFHYLKGLKLADYPSGPHPDLEVDILLGSDFMWRTMTGEIIQGEENEPVAIGSKFGWVLSGPVINMQRTLLSNVNLTTTHVLRADYQPVVEMNQDEVLDIKVNQLFDLESVGIQETDSVHESFTQNLKFENNRYTVKLPWREHHEILPDNFDLCVNRLTSTVKRLRKSPNLLEEYDKVIRDQMDQSIVEEIKPNLNHVEPGKVHYLSHHAVIRQEAVTTKLRVVMDASAKVSPSAPSLNEVLHTGPSLTPKILEILLRFRWHRIAIVADIMKAFHMINVDEKDRNVLRFLWLSDITSDNPELLFLRFCKVVFGLNCSPFLLGGTLHHHISNYEFENMEFVRKLLESFYVDDFLSGSSTLKEAIELFLNTKKCLADGGFTLRKWKTSDPQLRELIRENDQDIAQSTHEEVKPVSEDETSYAKLNLGDTVKTTEEYNKVLGLQWNYDSDEFLLTFRRLVEFGEKLTPTKRNLLKLTSMIFDPLGLISPVIVQVKMVLQEICQTKLDWDSPLPDELVIIWRKWLSDLEKVGHLRIERLLFCWDK